MTTELGTAPQRQLGFEVSYPFKRQLKLDGLIMPFSGQVNFYLVNFEKLTKKKLKVERHLVVQGVRISDEMEHEVLMSAPQPLTFVKLRSFMSYGLNVRRRVQPQGYPP
jgi:hypothetical protein